MAKNQSTETWYWEYGVLAIVASALYVIGLFTMLGG